MLGVRLALLACPRRFAASTKRVAVRTCVTHCMVYGTELWKVNSGRNASARVRHDMHMHWYHSIAGITMAMVHPVHLLRVPPVPSIHSAWLSKRQEAFRGAAWSPSPHHSQEPAYVAEMRRCRTKELTF